MNIWYMCSAVAAAVVLVIVARSTLPKRPRSVLVVLVAVSALLAWQGTRVERHHLDDQESRATFLRDQVDSFCQRAADDADGLAKEFGRTLDRAEFERLQRVRLLGAESWMLDAVEFCVRSPHKADAVDVRSAGTVRTCSSATEALTDAALAPSTQDSQVPVTETEAAQVVGPLNSIANALRNGEPCVAGGAQPPRTTKP